MLIYLCRPRVKLGFFVKTEQLVTLYEKTMKLYLHNGFVCKVLYIVHIWCTYIGRYVRFVILFVELPAQQKIYQLC